MTKRQGRPVCQMVLCRSSPMSPSWTWMMLQGRARPSWAWMMLQGRARHLKSVYAVISLSLHARSTAPGLPTAPETTTSQHLPRRRSKILTHHILTRRLTATNRDWTIFPGDGGARIQALAPRRTRTPLFAEGQSLFSYQNISGVANVTFWSYELVCYDNQYAVITDDRQ